MKKFIQGLLISSLMAAPVLAAPTNYNVDAAHSSVTFNIRHLVSTVEGRFRDFQGTIAYDSATPANSKVDFTIKSASIFTDNDQRDGHLKSPDFFDVAKYPTLEFHSKKVMARGKNLEVVGVLTIHGVSKPASLSVKPQGTAVGPYGPVAGFSTDFTINRKDFGIVWNKNLDSGSSMLGEDVNIRVLVEAGQAK